jgi:metal-dependent hydrolase (beta-lactamase superfamily II)
MNRMIIPVLLGAMLLLPGTASANTNPPSIRIVLLGTGRPAPAIDRFGPATLVEAGGQNLLFDAGRGASQRLWQLKIPLGQVDAVFLTHLHSDHTVGFPDVWLTGSTVEFAVRRIASICKKSDLRLLQVRHGVYFARFRKWNWSCA